MGITPQKIIMGLIKAPRFLMGKLPKIRNLILDESLHPEPIATREIVTLYGNLA